MQPGRIVGFTNVLKAPEGHDQKKLRIGELAIKAERVAGGICATSAWTPSPTELERLNAGDEAGFKALKLVQGYASALGV